MQQNNGSLVTAAQLEKSGAYRVERTQFLPDINTTGYLLRHKKTGARVILLPCEDPNKVFYIGFRTPPKDSTGVAHIIEHTVLCGSEHFPVRDPFLEVVKGSMNTFLNAMTYPDKTVYPVASTNERDFENLMHIYCDAVFHPNIYREQNIFRQEGWHIEALPHTPGGEDIDTDSELTINGVVYNEMRGAMSSADDVLNDKILQSLYPDTTYANVSGGDPERIPDLTYEKYLDFHRTFYHPSNSYLLLYGDMDMEERLDWLDRNYLGKYEKRDVDSAINLQAPFAAPVRKSFPVAILDGEDPAGKAVLSWNVSIPIRNEEENLAFKVLDYTLVDAEGAPVKEALRKKNIGASVSSLYESGIRQPYYSISARFADVKDEAEFVKTIEDTLRSLAEHGIDEKALLAGINFYEFHYREADFGSFPRGIAFGLDILDDWLYDDDHAFLALDEGKYFDALKEKVGTEYFTSLIQRFLLDNCHKAVVTLTPEPGLQTRQDAALKEKMAAYRASLSEKERKRIVDETIALKTWQTTPDTEEALQSIPVLARSDLKREALLPVNVLLSPDGKQLSSLPERGPVVISHPVFTSGIDYVNFQFDFSKIPARLFPYVAILRTVLGALDTEHYGYAALDQEVTIRTGGIYPNTSMFPSAKKEGVCTLRFEVTMKVLDRNLEAGMDLAAEIIRNTKYTDVKRIIEVLEEEVSEMKASLPESGHATAACRARSQCDESAKIQDQLSGIDAYRSMSKILEDLKAGTDVEGFLKKLKETAAFLFRRENLFLDITADAKTTGKALPLLAAFADALPKTGETAPADWDLAPYAPDLTKGSEGFATAGSVQYVAAAGNFVRAGYRYTGAMDVLRVILGYDYLWQRIRVLGGAYGCMSGFGRTGGAFFVTYRDPHLLDSLFVFAQAAEYLEHYDCDERAMTKSVIGAVSALDRPLSPRQMGRYSLQALLTGVTGEDLQRERDEVLTCTKEDIRALAGPVRAFLSQSCICVIGSKDRIDETGYVFDRIEQLI